LRSYRDDLSYLFLTGLSSHYVSGFREVAHLVELG
jgi:hypothetical protein